VDLWVLVFQSFLESLLYLENPEDQRDLLVLVSLEGRRDQ
jgi:hypothetical protein